MKTMSQCDSRLFERYLEDMLAKISMLGNDPPAIDGDVTHDEHPGTRLLDRYRVLEILGQGGMGTVFKAYDEVLGRLVALKILHGDVALRFGELLIREARALAQLSHANVVQAFDMGESDGQAFVAMEMLEGQNLRSWQQSTPRPSWPDCVRVYSQLGRGLAAAHSVGLVHRDFKPDNCFVDDDEERPRVLDFGLVTLDIDQVPDDPSDVEPEEGSTESGGDPILPPFSETNVIVGTLPYMSPEQMRGEPVGPSSDQFSFCVALYEAVYGSLPFEYSSFEERSVVVTNGEVLPEPDGSNVPSRLRHILLRGMASDPADRWNSMEQLVAELQLTPFPTPNPLRLPLALIVMWFMFSTLLSSLQCAARL